MKTDDKISKYKQAKSDVLSLGGNTVQRTICWESHSSMTTDSCIVPGVETWSFYRCLFQNLIWRKKWNKTVLLLSWRFV